MKKTTTDKQLAEMFGEFNGDFFAGRLPRYRVRFVEKIQGSNDPSGQCDDKRRVIRLVLHRLNDEADVESTLLHEMAHAAMNGYHGKRFQAEIHRLKDAGAPIADCVLQTEGPRYLTRHLFEDAAVDFLIRTPSGTFIQFLRQFAWWESDAYPADFIARYSWSRMVFYRARDKYKTREKLRH